MALPDIKDIGVIAAFERWGWPYHGLVQDGSMLLPDASIKTISQPAGGDVFALRVPGFTPADMTPEQIASDLAHGLQWYDYALISGNGRLCYGKGLAATSKETWIWAVSNTEKWLVELETAYVSSPYTAVTSGTYLLTLHMTVTLTEFGKFDVVAPAPVTHTINVSQPLSGTWSPWLGDAFVDPLPANNVVSLVDVSLDGKRAVLHLGRTYLTANQGARGFVEMTLNSTSSVSFVVLADAVKCCPADTSPATCHFWYNSSDDLEEVEIQMVSNAVHLLVDGVTRSTVSGTDFDGNSIANDATGFVNISVNFVQLSSAVGTDNETWAWVDHVEGHYTGDPLLTDEYPDQDARLFVEPVIYSNKAVGLSVTYKHYMEQVGFPYLWHLASDRYYGNIAFPGGVDEGVVHEIIATATCTGYVTDGTTFNVASVIDGTIAVGGILSAIGLIEGTVIVALGTGTGGVGTYIIDPSQVSTVAEDAPIAVSYPGKPYTTFQPVTGELTRNQETPVCYV
jgi:hypothetical protein